MRNGPAVARRAHSDGAVGHRQRESAVFLGVEQCLHDKRRSAAIALVERAPQAGCVLRAQGVDAEAPRDRPVIDTGNVVLAIE
jgi:hypothetical protein